MKKLFVLMIFMPLVGFAQKWDIGISTGVSVISKPDIPVDKSKMLLTPAVMISAGRIIKPKLRLGLDVDFVRLWRKAMIPSYDRNGQPVGTFRDGSYCIGNTAILIAPSLTYSISNFYFGGQFGYLATTDGTNAIAPESKEQYYMNGAKGFFGGLQAGYKRKISRSFSLNAELRSNYFQADLRSGSILLYRFNAFQYQAMFGMRYSF